MASRSHRVPEAPILQFGLQAKDRLHLGPALTAHGSTTSFGTPSGQRPWRAW